MRTTSQRPTNAPQERHHFSSRLPSFGCMSTAVLDYQLLFEESPDVLLVLLPDSPTFTAVAATKSRLSSTHSTFEKTVGRGLFELFPDNPQDGTANGAGNLRASLERVLATKAADTMAVQKYDIPLPDGSFEVRYWSPRNLPVLDADGQIRYIMHRAVDVTDIVRADEVGQELRGRSRDMEQEVVRRSRELDATNRELREANGRLNEVDIAKTNFFNNISHEFRTPLTLMLGPLSDCLSDFMPPAQRERVSLAHANALRLLKLVNELLDFASLEVGRYKASFAPLDLAQFTRELALMFQTAIDAAGIVLVIDCAPLSSDLWIDRGMWEKIVPNLLSNAFKFTLRGSITVRMSESETHAILEITDTGVGIPAGEVTRIFDRFHRVAGTAGRTHEGAGIGLALTRELVELHGGRITASSELGFGTTFRIEVPKGFEHLPAEAVYHVKPTERPASTRTAYSVEALRWSGTAQQLAAPPQPHDSERPRILIVDDNADLRSYMSGLLGGLYDVVTAGDGRAALSMIYEHAPDLILSDVMMPHMSGIELVQALRSDPETVSIPVILLSARAGEEATIEGLDAGSDDYLTKPFTAQELSARVRSLLHLSATRNRWTLELERANRELDAFSSSVAHDLRGPLRLIDGFGLMLLEENAAQLDAAGRQRLDMIRGSAKRMSQIIDDLLYLSRLSRSVPSRIHFDLSMLARSVAAALLSANPERQLEVIVQPGLETDADPNLVKIALENLLGNAWKFTSKRSAARIEFGLLPGAVPSTFFVRDNGAGFDMQYASKLFGVFQRLHAEAEFQGTGIGLATVSRIVNKHGGRIWASAEVECGATFCFTLEAQSAGARAAA